MIYIYFRKVVSVKLGWGKKLFLARLRSGSEIRHDDILGELSALLDLDANSESDSGQG